MLNTRAGVAKVMSICSVQAFTLDGYNNFIPLYIQASVISYTSWERHMLQITNSVKINISSKREKVEHCILTKDRRTRTIHFPWLRKEVVSCNYPFG
jgi:hypothetical protein